MRRYFTLRPKGARLSTWTTPVLMSFAMGALTVGCSDDEDPVEPDTVEDTTTDTDTDVTPEPDTNTDTDTTPDTTDPDTTEPDTTEPDVDVPDTTPDTVEDTTQDTTPDTDTTEPVGEFVVLRGDTCATLQPMEGVALPFSDSWSTVGLADNSIYSTGAVCGGVGNAILGDASPDALYAFTPPISGVYDIELKPAAGFDAAFMITDGCPPLGEDGFENVQCVAVSDNADEGGRERQRVELVGGKQYYLVVDGYSNDVAVAGAFTLNMVLGEHCSDREDNDGNGLVDCADPACTNDVACNESNYANGCADGIDNDNDGLSDCGDSDCLLHPSCDESTYTNGCVDGIDNDNDGLTDCADPQCALAAGCNESTYAGGCTDGIDNDRDGLIDCQDPDCGSHPSCNESTFSNGCADGLDNDHDGLTDCQDPNCGQASNCNTVAETCENAVEVRVGDVVSGTTLGRNNNYSISASNCRVSGTTQAFGAMAPDSVYVFKPTTTERYYLSLTGSVDLGLAITESCDFTGKECYAVERVSSTTSTERLVAPLTAGKTYFIIVDGYSNTTAVAGGNFTLKVERAALSTEVESSCSDGTDNDNDNKTDCADEDCVFSDFDCTEIGRCADGLDNDRDGNTDCADADCRADYLNCPTPVGDTCGSPGILTLEQTLTLDLCSLGRDYSFTSSTTGCTTNNASAKDSVVKFTAPSAGTYYFTHSSTSTSSFSTALNAVRSATCPTTVTQCVANGGTTTTTAKNLRIEMAAGESLWIIVSSQTNTCGSSTLTAELLPPEICNDGIDNDRNSQIDCADPACANFRTCNEAFNGDDACTDGLDNDRDGLVDCLDRDCRIHKPEICPSQIGEHCGSPLVITDDNYLADFNTCDYDDDVRRAPTGSVNCAGSTSTTGVTAKDIVVKFIPPATAQYRIRFDTRTATTGGTSAADVVLNITEGENSCVQVLSQCLAGTDSPPETIQREFTAGQTYFIYLDGYSSGCGLARFTIDRMQPEVCNDGIDNDGDNTTDCGDTDCASSPFCNEAVHGDTACTDGIDNDGNGLIDCADATCGANATACPNGMIGDTCANPLVITTGSFSSMVDTCNYNADTTRATTAPNCSGSSSNTAKDMVVKFVPPTTGPYRIRFDSRAATTGASSSPDVVLNITEGEVCQSQLTQCLAGTDSSPETILRDFTGGQTYYIYLDGYSTACGKALFTITQMEPEVCNDGIDNDGDDLIDCADTANCGQAPNCNEAFNGPDSCTDGIDNDGDGQVDCLDRDCRMHNPEACPSQPGETCGTAIPITTTTFTQTINTCDFEHSVIRTSSATGCTGDTTSAAKDVIFAFTPPVTGSYKVDVDARAATTGLTSWDATLNITEGANSCTSELSTCFASHDVLSGSLETVTKTFTAGTTYYIYADGYSTTSCGTARVSVTLLDAENCTDGIDNDGDGRIDCQDTDCYGVGTCPAGTPGDSCAAPNTLAVGSPVSYDSCDFSNSHSYPGSTAGCAMESTGAPDGVNRFTATTAGTYTFTLTNNDFYYDAILNVVVSDTCPAAITACEGNADNNYEGENEVVSVTLQAGQTAWIFTTGYYDYLWDTDDCGELTLSVSGPN